VVRLDLEGLVHSVLRQRVLIAMAART